jgi:molecular chaperone GrpE
MKKRKKKRDDADRPPSEDIAASAEGATGEPLEHAESATTEESPVALRERIDALEESLARTKADYQNMLRRSTVEQTNAVRYANAELMRSLLVVVDDFERSLAAAGDDAPAALVDGLRLVNDNLVRALAGQGLEVIDARHARFDPSVHEAMMQQPTDEHDPGTVIEQLAKGYRLGDRVIRPAKVIVAVAPADGAERRTSAAPSSTHQQASAE